MGAQLLALRFDVATRDEIRRTAAGQAPELDESDGSLLALSAGGDLDAFAVLVTRYQPMVMAVSSRMLASAGEADDIAQEALLRLWRLAGQLVVGEAGAAPWLRRVTSNLCLDRLRASGRLAAMDDSVPEPFEPPTQLDRLARHETAERVDIAVRALPDRQRAALTLFHYEDLSLADIAARLGLSVDAVESLLARARRTLRKQLQTEWRDLVEDTP